MARTPTRLDGLLAKVETTYGTDPTPVAADDGVRVSGRIWTGVTPDFAFDGRRDEEHTGTLRMAPPVERGGRIATVSFDWSIRGAGTAYSMSNLPEASALLRACAHSETVDATSGSETVTYEPVDEGHESVTLYAYSAGKLYKLLGCRGVVTWPLTAGNVSRLHFEFSGLLPDDPTEVALPSITYSGALPQVAKAMTVSIGSFTPVVESGEFSSGGAVQRLDDASATDAVEAFAISAQDPSYTLQVPTETVSTFDPHDVSQGATAQTIDQDLGDTQYNRLKLDSSEAYLDAPQHVETNGFASWTLPFQLTDYSLVFD